MMNLYGDGHVHIHRIFDLERLFSTALKRAAGLGGPLLLLLAESGPAAEFTRLLRAGSVRPGSRIVCRGLSDPISMRIEREGDAAGAALYLIAGRQFVSSEGLELLALGMNPDNPLAALNDGTLPAEEIIQLTLKADAVSVLPWGVGKWIGRRGRLVEQLARSPAWAGDPRCLLGDIAHRCYPWPEPALFKDGAGILPGTDLLPLPGLEARVARYGFRMAAAVDPENPGRSLLEQIRRGTAVMPHGRREPLYNVLREQILYRWRGRGRTA
jgi:hypothetical protein